ncbi:MAG: DnaD domain protein [Peptococcaceae bacterium]|nr:DnaD domain protein [Peptococcaceae bacterium]
MIRKIRNTVKKYQEGNIPAAYGADLWLSGATNVPNLLLKFYRDMNLTDIEVMTLIHMFRLCNEEKNLKPDGDTLADFMSAGNEEINKTIKSLFDKKVIVETLFYDKTADSIVPGYDFEPLFDKLSDCWACLRAKENEKVCSKLDKLKVLSGDKEILAQCYSIFEMEFGRPLSPIEIERVSRWVENYKPDIIQEALSRAVLMGKRNFRYIDTILLDWSKNNLNSIEAIAENDRDYQKKRPVRHTKDKPGERTEGRIDSETNKREEYIKKIYLT